MGAARKALAARMERAVRHHRLREDRQAEALYRQVLAIDDCHLPALHLLGSLLLEKGNHHAAIELIQKAVAVAPDEAVLFSNLGEGQRRTGDYDGAIANFERAISLQPALGEAHYGLGLALRAAGRSRDAVLALGRAATLKADFVPIHTTLAELLHEMDHLDEAEQACVRALQLDANCAEAHNRLGHVLHETGRIDEAIVSFRRAIACRPDQPIMHSNLVYALGWDPAQESGAILAEASRWRERHAASIRPLPHANDRNPDRRLRVGYVSPDFYNHCHSLFLIPLFTHHHREAVEVIAYSFVSRPDDYTGRIRALCDEFREIREMSDVDAAAAIRADRVDVLVDLSMHLPHNRLMLFAQKPAPVQVTWLAYPGTTGLDAMDYRITDVFLDPPGLGVETAYAEKSVHLPETFWCYHPLAREPEVSDLPVLASGRITFGGLNGFGKTNGAVFALWARVLQAVAGSRLIMIAPKGNARVRVHDVFARAGVDPERVEFVEIQPRRDYLALYRQFDVCLDTFPHNDGGTTSLDAFWMGVPVVTLAGRTPVGRAGLCYASNLGLPELVARTPDEFVTAAVACTADRSRLAALRAELRTRIERSPLMDAPRFARHLEAGYRWMWKSWCSGA